MSSWGGGNWGGGGDWGAGGDWGPGRALGGSSSGQQNLKKRPAAAADDNDEVHASKRRKTNAGAAAASSSAASGAPKAKAKASPKASPKAKAASAAGAKRTTVSASEITNHFKSKSDYDETFAPHGLSLRNQAQTILSISTALGNQRGGGAAAGSSSAPHQPADTALSHLQIRHIANALSLFREGKDIPFIARYRKALTNDMSEDALRLLKKSLHKLDELEKKRASIILLLQKKKHTHTISKKTFDNVERALSMEELEALYEPYKETIPSKSSLARALGLEYLAEAILRGEDEERLLKRCRAVVGEIKAGRVKGSEEVAVAKKDLPTTADQVLELAMALAADMLFEQRNVEREPDLRRWVKYTSKQAGGAKKDSGGGQHSAWHKYQLYLDFAKPLRHVRGYQFLAIARAVDEKILKAGFAWDSEDLLEKICCAGFRCGRDRRSDKSPADKVLKKTVSRLKKLVERQYTRELKERAIEEAVDRFRGNLSQKLLTPPARLWMSGGKNDSSSAGGAPSSSNYKSAGAKNNIVNNSTIIALDPGFKHGTKIAVVSMADSSVVATETLHLVSGGGNPNPQAVTALANLIQKHRPQLIGVGNGHGSQEVQGALGGALEQVVSSSSLSATTSLASTPPELVLVDETGASVYSTTELAAKELPDLDNTHRSAVSLARRLLDPLAEFVKIPPKSLGVGQYQHSVPEKTLETEAESCFVDCISQVGVDLQTCSAELLQYVPGVGAKRAATIVQNRALLKKKRDLVDKMKGIGGKIFEQCAGFVYVSSAERVEDRSPHIHPEQFGVVGKLQTMFGGNGLPDITSAEELGDSVGSSMVRKKLENLLKELVVGSGTPALSGGAAGSSMGGLAGESSSAAAAPVIENGANKTTSIWNMTTLCDLCRELIPPSRGGRAGRDARVDEERPPGILGAGGPPQTQGSSSLAGGGKGTSGGNKFGAGASSSGSSGGDALSGVVRKHPEDLNVGDTLSGVVRNTTDFAAFIDLGVGRDAFLHVSKWNGVDMRINKSLTVRVTQVRQVGGEQKGGKGGGKGGKDGKGGGKGGGKEKQWKIDVELAM